MDVKQQVYLRLKPRVKALGFNKKELQGVAANIANNLSLEEDASEDDVNTAIDEQIEIALPFLQLAQAQASRIIDASRKASEEDEDIEVPQKKSSQSPKEQPTDEEPAWFKAYRESQDARFAALEKEKISDSRKMRLEKLVKDTGTFGTRTLKSFSKMTFDSDDEFDEFISDVEEDLKALNQERADYGLSKLGTVPSPMKETQKKDEPYSDEEIDRLVNNF